MNRALFLDRDGVVNEDEGYLYEIDKCRFVDGVFEVVKLARALGFLPIIVTNQSGIARGYYTEQSMHDLHNYMQAEFRKRGAEIEKFYYCPYHPKGVIKHLTKVANCRKPKPGMFLEAKSDFDIDFSKSIMVGDKPSDRVDIEGLKSYIIKSEYSKKDYDIATLLDFIPILKKSQNLRRDLQ